MAISQRLLGMREVAIFHHTECGMLTFTNKVIRDKVKSEEPGNAAVVSSVDSIDFLPFPVLIQSAKDGVTFVKENPLVLDGTIATGSTHDVRTGKACYYTLTSPKIQVYLIAGKGRTNCVTSNACLPFSSGSLVEYLHY